MNLECSPSKTKVPNIFPAASVSSAICLAADKTSSCFICPGFLVGEGPFVGVDNEGELAGDALGSVYCN